MKVDVLNMAGDKVETVELPSEIFEAPIKSDLMHQAFVRQLANARLGTHSTKGRGEVSGGGAKPWRQKGTGRARAGTINSPIWVGGGRAFGPHPRNHYRAIPKKMKRVALLSALSDRAGQGKIKVLDIPSMERPRTREVVSMLEKLELMKDNVLFLLTEPNDNFILSCRNLKNVKCMRASVLNAYQVLWADCIVIPPDCPAILEKEFGK
jgi:large subunit ribosomal protein L4